MCDDPPTPASRVDARGRDDKNGEIMTEIVGVDMVVNLTPPAAHVAVSQAAIAAGKHVYSEKPLALSLDEGRALLARAERAGVEVGCAPDTFLGTGLQTTARALRVGMIGTPVAAMAAWGGPGPELWHPDPQF